jgi:hypothetical protein
MHYYYQLLLVFRMAITLFFGICDNTPGILLRAVTWPGTSIFVTMYIALPTGNVSPTPTSSCELSNISEKGIHHVWCRFSKAHGGVLHPNCKGASVILVYKIYPICMVFTTSMEWFVTKPSHHGQLYFPIDQYTIFHKS